MMNEMIKEIKKAEENASQLIINAQAEAKYRIEQASEELKKAQYDEENRLEAELEEKLNEAKKEAEKIIEKSEVQAKKDCADIEKKAKTKMPKTIDFILEVIKESWQ